MKFTVNSDLLAEKLAKVASVVSAQAVVPILENILVVVEGGTCTLTASDLQTTMRTSVAVRHNEKLAIAAPAKALVDIINQLPCQDLVLSYNAPVLSILSDNGKYSISCENAADFPKVIEVSEQRGVIEGVLNSNVLLDALKHTFYAVSTEYDMKPAMTGMYMNLNGQAVFAGTDGSRLVKVTEENTQFPKQGSAIIQRKAMQVLKQHVRPGVQVGVMIGSSNAKFSFEGFELICRLIDERYPDFEMFIPKDNPISIQLDRKGFIASLKRVMICTDKKTLSVKITIANQSMKLTTSDELTGADAEETLHCRHIGNTLEIGFNSKFLMDALTVLNSEDVLMEFSAPSRPALIKPAAGGNKNVVMMLAPVSLAR